MSPPFTLYTSEVDFIVDKRAIKVIQTGRFSTLFCVKCALNRVKEFPSHHAVFWRPPFSIRVSKQTQGSVTNYCFENEYA